MSAPAIELDLNGPTVAFSAMPNAMVDQPIFRRFEAVVESDPQAVAVLDGTLELTREAVLALSLTLARVLRLATKADGRVAILLPSTAWYPVAALGCLAASRIYAALDPVYPAERNAAILAEFSPDCIIASGDILALQALYPLAAVLDIEAVAEGGFADCPATPMGVGEPAFVIYTSGSTGTPKGILNSQQALMQRVLQQVNAAHISEKDVVLCLASSCTIAGTREMFTALLSGALLLMADPERLGLRGMRRWLKDYRATLFYAVPSLARALIGTGEDDTDFAHLRVVRLGGEKVEWSDIVGLQRVLPRNARIQVGYSSTETTGTQWFVPPGVVPRGRTPPIGYMLPGVEFAVVGEDGMAANDIEGELVIRSPYVALGIWHQSDGPLGASDADEAGRRILHTGDIVRLSADGMLEVLGRKDRQIKINGRRVEPAEIEAVMRLACGVVDAVVLPHRREAATGIVGFVAATVSPGIVEAVRGRLAASLPPAWHPTRIHVVRKLPRLPSGKIDGQALMAMDQLSEDAALETVSHPPYDSMQRMVAAAWTRVLGRRRLRPGQGWDAAGGDSLNLLRLVFELERDLNRRLPLECFHMAMDVDSMAAIIGDLDRQKGGASDERPTVVLFPGLTGDSPSLASFRVDLAAHFDFVTMAYPAWRSMAADASTIETIAERLASDIVVRIPEGGIRLAGYSLGGAIGYEVALRLIGLGRHVEWLAVLDASVDPAGQARLRSGARLVKASVDFLKGKQSVRQRICQAAAGLATRRRHEKILAWLVSATALARLPASFRFTFEMEVCEALQRRSLETWIRSHNPVRIPTQVCLFRSQEPRSGIGRDLGWSRLFDKVVVRDVAGSHIDMLRQPHRADLCRQFLATVPMG